MKIVRKVNKVRQAALAVAADADERTHVKQELPFPGQEPVFRFYMHQAHDEQQMRLEQIDGFACPRSQAKSVYLRAGTWARSKGRHWVVVAPQNFQRVVDAFRACPADEQVRLKVQPAVLAWLHEQAAPPPADKAPMPTPPPLAKKVEPLATALRPAEDAEEEFLLVRLAQARLLGNIPSGKLRLATLLMESYAKSGKLTVRQWIMADEIVSDLVKTAVK